MGHRQTEQLESEASKIAGLPFQPADNIGFAQSYHQRRAVKARKLREAWIETGCDRLMTFVEFRQEGVRNKLRRAYGLPPIILPQRGASAPPPKPPA